ncbi:polyamine-modulated factor 1 isoform X3 [Equus przewalskii]
MTQRIYDKFITQLQTSIREEISEIKAEGNLEAVLNALDTIVEEGKDHKEPAWRPSGIPEKDLQRAMVPYFLQQRDALQRRVQKQEAENRQLADAVLAGRRQVEELQLQGQARQQAWQAQPREYKRCWRLGEAAQLSPEQQHQHTMRPLPLLALLALAALCLAGWAGECPQVHPSQWELRGESAMALPLLTPSTGSPFGSLTTLLQAQSICPQFCPCGGRGGKSKLLERQGRRGRTLGMSRVNQAPFLCRCKAQPCRVWQRCSLRVQARGQ